jgi:hypothetical protein
MASAAPMIITAAASMTRIVRIMNVFSEKGDRFIFPAPHPEQSEQPLSSPVRPDGHSSFCRAEAYGSYSSTKGRFFSKRHGPAHVGQEFLRVWSCFLIAHKF